MLYAVLVVALVALDQLVKYLVVQNIPLGEYVPFLPHILDLTYVQNTGAAFSLFSEHTWLLTLISLVMSVLLLMALVRGFFLPPFGPDLFGPAAGGLRWATSLTGLPGLCGGYVPCALHGVCCVQCGGHLCGGGGYRRRGLLCMGL